MNERYGCCCDQNHFTILFFFNVVRFVCSRLLTTQCELIWIAHALFICACVRRWLTSHMDLHLYAFHMRKRKLAAPFLWEKFFFYFLFFAWHFQSFAHTHTSHILPISCIDRQRNDSCATSSDIAMCATGQHLTRLAFNVWIFEANNNEPGRGPRTLLLFKKFTRQRARIHSYMHDFFFDW